MSEKKEKKNRKNKTRTIVIDKAVSCGPTKIPAFVQFNGRVIRVGR